MSSSRLKLNSEKTQFIWLGSRQKLSKVGVAHVNLGNHAVIPLSTVWNLGIHLDGQLTMKAHVQRICRKSFYQLRQLRSVRLSLSVNACTALVHAFVTSRVGIGDGLIDQLHCRLWCEWRPAWSSGSASSTQSRLTFVITLHYITLHYIIVISYAIYT